MRIKPKKYNVAMINIILISLVVLLVVYNQFQIASISGGISGSATSSSTISSEAREIIPTGVPEIYGQELGISFNDISVNNQNKADQTISLLGSYDDSITLSEDDLQRYIDIVLQISCEYCCGAASIIFNNGKAACGCAHSYAMRGLAKYLIKNHPAEFTDDEILGELGKWKVLFFPDIHIQKAQVLKEEGIEINYINLASNKYRGIEKGEASGGSMVGGC